MSPQQAPNAERMPRLLSEQPAYEDRFGVHERIAEQLRWIIEEITRNGGETKKNVVALFGTWGSGKSTVINLLEKKVRDTHIVIQYDSWSHRDEHLKKAFLLHLLDQLNLNEIPYMRKRKNKITLRDAVTGRVKEQTITREPMPISITIYLFGILFLLGSISVSLLGILKLLHFNAPLPGWSIITIVFSYLMLSVVLFFRKDDIAGRILLLKTPISISEAITNFGEMEIPSIQFQEFFSDILKRWKEKENRPLIIVLDNLDRVDDETVSRFFSLIQSALDAFERLNSGGENIHEYMVFIVPIDKDRVRQVLRGMIHPGNVSDGGDVKSFGEDFLKKLFPYAVEIPELVASNWRRFLKGKLLEAFHWLGDHEVEIDLITGLFYQGVRSSERQTTPREIIHFVNDMAHNAWTYANIVQNELTPQAIVVIALYTAIIRYDEMWRKMLNHGFPENDEEENVSNKKTGQSHLMRVVANYIGTVLPRNYSEQLLQLHFRTRNIWDLLLQKPLQDIVLLSSQAYSVFGGNKEEGIEKKIKPMFEGIPENMREETLVEVFNSFLDEHIGPLVYDPVRLGRFVWLADKLGVYQKGGIKRRAQSIFYNSLLQLSLTGIKLDLDLETSTGFLLILKEDFPERSEVHRMLAQSILNTLDIMANQEERADLEEEEK